MPKNKYLRVLLGIAGGIFSLLLILFIYLYVVATVQPPVPDDLSSLELNPVKTPDGLMTIHNSWFRQSQSGLYELYVEGNPFERGVIIGKLTRELVHYQEEVFTQQIHRLVPNTLYLEFLKYFVGWFNRNLEDQILPEYKMEIFGVSESASHEFDDIAPPYHRLLNYHAAHDIGHALQNMSFVGCTSFGVWGTKSADSTLLIGRNFDFYVGQDFARDKIIAFYNPDQGHKFMMVTWGGMTGVLSGMNDQGLTVTINAAKSAIPSGSATPVSIVAREILQYAKNISEARHIAEQRKVFVSESFLVGSAFDGKAAVIEKTESETGFYESGKDYIICANHFQSELLSNTELNLKHMKTSPSPYRHNRMEELLNQKEKISVTDAAEILRNQLGLGGKDIGLGNEKAINQLISHHAIIFQPERLKVWISTSPYQLGKFICYDLNKIFSSSPKTDNVEISDSTFTISEDPFLYSLEFKNYQKFVQFRFPFSDRSNLNPDRLVQWNTNSYLSYMLGGDHFFKEKEYAKAQKFYELGLGKEVSSTQEANYMMNQIKICKEKLQ